MVYSNSLAMVAAILANKVPFPEEREPRIIHGAVLSEEEIAKDREALTPEERAVLDSLPTPNDD